MSCITDAQKAVAMPVRAVPALRRGKDSHKVQNAKPCDPSAVRRYWESLDTNDKVQILCFEEPALVQQVHSSNQALCQSEMLCFRQGIPGRNLMDKATMALVVGGFDFVKVGNKPKAVSAKRSFAMSESLFSFFEGELGGFLSSSRRGIDPSKWFSIFKPAQNSWSGFLKQLLCLVEQAIRFSFHSWQASQPSAASLNSGEVLADNFVTDTSMNGQSRSKIKHKKKHRCATSILHATNSKDEIVMEANHDNCWSKSVQDVPQHLASCSTPTNLHVLLEERAPVDAPKGLHSDQDLTNIALPNSVDTDPVDVPPALACYTLTATDLPIVPVGLSSSTREHVYASEVSTADDSCAGETSFHSNREESVILEMRSLDGPDDACGLTDASEHGHCLTPASASCLRDNHLGSWIHHRISCDILEWLWIPQHACNGLGATRNVPEPSQESPSHVVIAKNSFLEEVLLMPVNTRRRAQSLDAPRCCCL